MGPWRQTDQGGRHTNHGRVSASLHPERRSPYAHFPIEPAERSQVFIFLAVV